MTTLREKAIAVDQVMREAKTDWVATKPESTDLAIYIHAYRGEDVVAALQCPLEREAALKAFQITAVGMSPDTLMATLESWHSTLDKSPVTGQDWMRGEMAFVGATYPEAQQEGWVSECLTTNAFDREGDYVVVSTPYLIQDHQVTFKESIVHDSSEAEGSGVMQNAFLAIMQLPTVIQTLEKDEDAKLIQVVAQFIPDPEVRQFHMDCAALKAMAEQDLITAAALMAEEGSARKQMIIERFGDSE